MVSKQGKLVGIGVGPGDPELMTLRAMREISQCDFVVLPNSGKEINAAYTIAEGAFKQSGSMALETKEILEVDMPMIRDKKQLAESHKIASEKIIARLKKGENGVFLTLGDPTIYSTYIYVHEIITAEGYETEIVPGVPSFCAVAARLNMGLTDAEKALHIIPASYEGLDEQLSYKGTGVLMKSGKAIGKVKEALKGRPDIDVKMVERCGMTGEKVYRSLEEIDEEAGYFSIIVVKEKV